MTRRLSVALHLNPTCRHSCPLRTSAVLQGHSMLILKYCLYLFTDWMCRVYFEREIIRVYISMKGRRGRVFLYILKELCSILTYGTIDFGENDFHPPTPNCYFPLRRFVSASFSLAPLQSSTNQVNLQSLSPFSSLFTFRRGKKGFHDR